jgi:HK97 family phage major capsid protein
MATLKDMLDEQARIRAELQRMEQDEDITEEKDGDYRDTLVSRWEELDEATKPLIARMEKVRGITRSAASPENREAGDGTVAVRGAPEFLQRRDPHEGLDKVKANLVSPRDMISRSLTAVEMHNKQGLLEDDRAEEATRKAQRHPGIAKHMLLTGSDDYVESFRAYLEDPTGQGMARTALSLTLANGGYLLPYVLDPTIVLSSSGSANPFRRIGRVVQTTSNAWQGVSSAGVSAQWLGESTTASDASPAIGQIQVYPQKGAAWVYGSFEVRDDTNLSDQLPRLLADAKDRLEETAFAQGTGGTGNSSMPRGVLVGLGTSQRVTAAATTGGALAGTTGAVDIYNLQAALPPRFRLSPNVGWVANITWINKARALDQYGGSSFWANLGSGTPETLLGQPIYESTSITTSTATGTSTGQAAMVYGDWSNFIIVDRIGTSMLYEPMITGTGAAANVPTGQSGWFYFWRVGSDVATSAAFRFLTNGG